MRTITLLSLSCLAFSAQSMQASAGTVASSSKLPAAIGASRALVAVIDSGVARTAELQNVVVAEYDFAAIPARPAFQPRYNHGTQVSTILHREAKGQVDIVSLRIDDPGGCPPKKNPPCQPSARPIAMAIYKAMGLGVDVINISLAIKDDPMIAKAIYFATRQGIQVVLAAGNDGFEHPGNMGFALVGHPNTVLVGALDNAGAPWRWTNRPEAVSSIPYNYAWQLGVDVPTANADGTETRATGTSVAAPIEAAHRALRAPRLLVRDAKATTVARAEWVIRRDRGAFANAQATNLQVSGIDFVTGAIRARRKR